MSNILKIEVDDLGPEYPKFYLESTHPGSLTYVHVPFGFYWLPSTKGSAAIEVHPRWWKKLQHKLTGRW